MVPTTCPFFNGAVSCGSFQRKAGLQVFKLPTRNRHRPRIARPQIDLTLIAKPDPLRHECRVRFNRRDRFKEAETPGQQFF
ncbi:Uncharacterised protein [Salmonella enterica subsp. enterica]|uniref:Uncharacterized protein n=1 Tax=Salmonella enterica I TaxID=59201 RepID=A0A379WBH5_SALET|nr:Uncharacterised protein [Salmonella enterica subsp. enterica]